MNNKEFLLKNRIDLQAEDVIPSSVFEITETLNKAGFRAYPIGGCVRDLLLGKKPSDWDIATESIPSETKKVFSNEKVIETGIKHGTVTVIKSGKPFEITTFRGDGEYSDGRHPDTVKFTTSLAEDLMRRDFTINAMALDVSSGKVYDPSGGLSDLSNGIIKCVGNPKLRFKEDALRIMRGLRFASVLSMEIEPETESEMFNCREGLGIISAERLKVEMEKLLTGVGVAQVLREYRNILEVFIPEIVPMADFDQKNIHHIYDVWEHTIRVVENTPPTPIYRWAALFHDMGKPAAFFQDNEGVGHFYGHGKISREICHGIMTRLRFDRQMRERIELLTENHDMVLAPTEKAVKRLLRRFGYEGVQDLVTLAKADNMGQNPAYRDRQKTFLQIEKIIKNIKEKEECFSLKDLDITGNEIKELGYSGRDIGDCLNRLLTMVIEGEVQNVREELIKKAEEYEKKTD